MDMGIWVYGYGFNTYSSIDMVGLIGRCHIERVGLIHAYLVVG
jgi:hypothetical protein